MKIELTPEQILSWPFTVDQSGHAQVMFLGMPVSRSRLVVWAATGRLLEKGKEIVHHIDENKLNDLPINLIVMTRSAHMKHHNFLQPWIGQGWPKGKPRAVSARAKIAAKHRGMKKPWLVEDKERNRKISEFRKTYRYSAEARQKISDGLKKHFAQKRAEKALLEKRPDSELVN